MITIAVSQQATKVTPAITSVVQCTPSSTREKATVAMASPANSQPGIRTARWEVTAMTHSAKTVKTRHAVAE